ASSADNAAAETKRSDLHRSLTKRITDRCKCSVDDQTLALQDEKYLDVSLILRARKFAWN
ncbi:hypothetical protein, partial [Chromobacterium fluminis]|uniref:hypothetical protein n=1 Tax=Chromobacterium fluminis TaxID=3044269 RepID=UPI001980F781